MQIVITGHTSGIGKIIFEYFGGTGLSRATGFDISKNDITPFLNIDTILINNAYDINNPFSQIKLLYNSYNIVKHVICIGSNTPHEGIYKTSKDALDIACKDLYYKGYNITNIKLGKVETPFQKNFLGNKISKQTIIKTLEYIFSVDERISEISIRPKENYDGKF